MAINTGKKSAASRVTKISIMGLRREIDLTNELYTVRLVVGTGDGQGFVAQIKPDHFSPGVGGKLHHVRPIKNFERYLRRSKQKP